MFKNEDDKLEFISSYPDKASWYTNEEGKSNNKIQGDGKKINEDSKKLTEDIKNVVYDTKNIFSNLDAPSASTTEEETMGKKYVYCTICKLAKPERAHHCSVCRKCYLRMDHHCFWVGNCIGLNNHKFFLMFIFYTILLSILVLITCILDLNKTLSKKQELNIVRININFRLV